MRTYRFDHFHLKSIDPDRAAAFYVDMLGAKLVGRADVNGSTRVTIEMAGLPVFIDRVPASLPVAPEAPFRGLEHLGLLVDDIEGAIAELKEKGAEIVVEPHLLRPGLKIAFILGPDNVRIELLERAPAP